MEAAGLGFFLLHGCLTPPMCSGTLFCLHGQYSAFAEQSSSAKSLLKSPETLLVPHAEAVTARSASRQPSV